MYVIVTGDEFEHLNLILLAFLHTKLFYIAAGI